jgi:hypothetical protein
MFALFQVEMAKQWRRPRTYVALGLAVLVPVIVAISLKANPPGAPGTATGRGFGGENDPLSFLATKTGLVLPVFVLQVMSGFLLVVPRRSRLAARGEVRWVGRADGPGVE